MRSELSAMKRTHPRYGASQRKAIQPTDIRVPGFPISAPLMFLRVSKRSRLVKGI